MINLNTNYLYLLIYSRKYYNDYQTAIYESFDCAEAFAKKLKEKGYRKIKCIQFSKTNNIKLFDEDELQSESN